MTKTLILFLLLFLIIPSLIFAQEARSNKARRQIVSRITALSEPGQYVNGDWEYNLMVWNDHLEQRYGSLKFRGREIAGKIGSVLETPLGTLISADRMSPGQVGYNTGWLMAVVVHNMKESNRIIPVFLKHGKVNPKVLNELSISEKDVRKVTLKMLNY